MIDAYPSKHDCGARASNAVRPATIVLLLLALSALLLCGCAANGNSQGDDDVVASASTAAAESSNDDSSAAALGEGEDMGNNEANVAGGNLMISVNGRELTAQFEGNPSAAALNDFLSKGPLTIDMSDYGSFEKVGEIGTTLPQSNEQITTVPGDVVLYQGDKLVIYYAPNSWNFTKVAHIPDMTTETMKEFLGDGTIEATFSIE